MSYRRTCKPCSKTALARLYGSEELVGHTHFSSPAKMPPLVLFEASQIRLTKLARRSFTGFRDLSQV